MATTTIHIRPRAQTVGEEVANSISHGIATVAALIGLPVLIVAHNPKARPPSSAQ
jgi:predicted membrane channel-forming protein YqfA (hemolysin III family)